MNTNPHMCTILLINLEVIKSARIQYIIKYIQIFYYTREIDYFT